MPRPAFHILETQGCDYAAWRLFLLSLLWRMDRSKLAELAPVDLGEARAEIQEMITAGDAGAPMDYPCWIYILALSEQQMREFMSTPSGSSTRDTRSSNSRSAPSDGSSSSAATSRATRCADSCSTAQKESVKWLVEGFARIDEMGNWTEGLERHSVA